MVDMISFEYVCFVIIPHMTYESIGSVSRVEDKGITIEK